MLKNRLKRYDRRLSYKRYNDGAVIVLRYSPFNKGLKHRILHITNQYIGSGKWVLNKLIEMDTTRNDIVGSVSRFNRNIREKKEDTTMHEELADFMLSGGSIAL